MKKIYFFCMLITGQAMAADTTYVNSAYTGTSTGTITQPYKSLSNVSSIMATLSPGDFVLFKRGEVYSGTLTITRSGTAGNYITFGAYGSGADPLFFGTGSTVPYLFYTFNRSYLKFENLNITDTTIPVNDKTVLSKIQRAFTFDGTGSSRMYVKNCSVDRAGVGAYLVMGENIFDSCRFFNLRMVVNTNTGPPPGTDDDYGANPFVISSAGNRITHCFLYNNWANSFDYGYDGGAIEFFGNGASDNFIGYNTMYDNIGISELTGTSSGNKYVYNIMVNNGSLVYLQNSGITGLSFFNNIISETVPPRVPESRIIGGSGGSLATGAVILKNNVFHLTNGVDVASSAAGITHSHNIFYNFSGGSTVNFTLAATELATSAPLFTSTSGAPQDWNYAPLAGSVINDFGTAVGGGFDFAGNLVPAVPNAGILEPVAGPLPGPVRITQFSTNIRFKQSL